MYLEIYNELNLKLRLIKESNKNKNYAMSTTLLYN